MDEVETQGEVLESAAPQTSQQDQPVAEAQQVEAPVDDRQERNWREMRRVKEDLERKVKMQEELLGQLMSQNQSRQVAPQEEVDELAHISADDYIPKGQVEKLVKRAEMKAEKLAEQAVEKALREREKAQFHERLKSKFTDFDEIVNPETLELLDQHDPELAKTIADLGDPYKIGLQSYKYIKSMGLSEKSPAYRRAKEVDKRIEENSKTVQSPQAYDKRPMAQTFKLTEAQKANLYKEMMEYANQGGGY